MARDLFDLFKIYIIICRGLRPFLRGILLLLLPELFFLLLCHFIHFFLHRPELALNLPGSTEYRQQKTKNKPVQ